MWLRTMIAGAGDRFDGKTLRGARDAGTWCACWVAAAGVLPVAVGKHDPQLRLLDTMITDAVITADALRCQRETAEAIVEAGGHYILTVSQPAQPARGTKALPWKHSPS